MPITLDIFDPRQFIIIKGAKVNNLKNIDVVIPRNKMVVITGLSGSGKSSLAFDTLFAEGQRMYVESLSSYARQFLGRMEKPDVEYIRGISPAIAVEQKANTKNPRATVGTTTEVYDYMKLLYARIGKTYSPISGKEVKKDTVTDVVNYIHTFEEGQKFIVLAPLKVQEERSLEDELKIIFQKGFSRLVVQEETLFIEDILKDKTQLKILAKAEVFILIDRNIVKKEEEDNQFRIADSVQTAFFEGLGTCLIDVLDKEKKRFSDRFELDGMSFEEPSVQFFSFNNPYGACQNCGGFGTTLGLDESLIIPNKNLSVYEGAVAPWTTPKMQAWRDSLVKATRQFDFPIHRSYSELSEKEKDILWQGNKFAKGINAFFADVERQSHKIQYRVLLSRYRGRITCPECRGTRLRKDANYVKIANTSISDLTLTPLNRLLDFFENLKLNEYEHKVAHRILSEIQSRLSYLDKVGLGYLTLNRLTKTLSGGEYQRIRLATALGSALVGSMYILDEPSIGLHPRDTARLVEVLKDLRDLGNTVIIVEHEEEIMQAADQIIDIGVNAGALGGDVIFSLSAEELEKSNGKTKNNKDYSFLNTNYKLKNSHTYNFLKGYEKVEVPKKRRAWTEYIEVKGCREHNLKNIDVKFPLDTLTVVTGVSGSGKSTLIKKILYASLVNRFDRKGEEIGDFDELEGSLSYLKGIEFINQDSIGRSSRSNPATYTKVYDAIRDLFANVPLAKQRGYDSGYFSFNADKGRCETCQGEGKIKIEMQFMADVYLTCETCKGKRFKKEVLEVLYQNKDISDVLEMTVAESVDFFVDNKRIKNALQPLLEVGLGYVKLGQPTSTLSGGESQRLKLASFLKERTGRTLFIFDEPTTGLHFHDIKKLLQALNKLIDNGNSVLIIEHNLEVIKSADWLIDLGKEGGEAGGSLCFAGIPEDLVKLKDNHTAEFLRGKV